MYTNMHTMHDRYMRWLFSPIFCILFVVYSDAPQATHTRWGHHGTQLLMKMCTDVGGKANKTLYPSWYNYMISYIDGWMQDCGISVTSAFGFNGHAQSHQYRLKVNSCDNRHDYFWSRRRYHGRHWMISMYLCRIYDYANCTHFRNMPWLLPLTCYWVQLLKLHVS